MRDVAVCGACCCAALVCAREQSASLHSYHHTPCRGSHSRCLSPRQTQLGGRDEAGVGVEVVSVGASEFLQALENRQLEVPAAVAVRAQRVMTSMAGRCGNGGWGGVEEEVEARGQVRGRAKGGGE